MSLQSKIDPRLWESVESRFEDGDFSGAILDAFYFLSDLIRTKSGVESDGGALIGAAFAGQNPLVKINALKTESDISEQKGMDQLLRGLYLCIRNPRSHEKRVDSAATADHVITFISFLVGLIDSSKSPFDIEEILSKVFDRHFVPTEQYAAALVAKIPAGKREEVLIRLFSRRSEGRIRNVSLVLRAILATSSTEVQLSFWDTVSSALEEAAEDADVRTAVYITSPDWSKLSEVARLRTEHRLIESVREGAYDLVKDRCVGGSLGGWAGGRSHNFIMRAKLRDVLIDLLDSGADASIDYVMSYFRSELFSASTPPGRSLEITICNLLDANDRRIADALGFLNLESCHPDWKVKISGFLEAYKLRNAAAAVDDDIPF